MRILFLVHRVPYPPTKGEKIRAFHELQFLAARHSIDLFCFADSPQEAAEALPLEEFCGRCYIEPLSRISRVSGAAHSLWGGEPLSVGYFFSPKMRSEVERALAANPYDLILVYCSSMAQYVPRPAPAPVVIDFVDTDSAKWSQYAQTCSFPFSWIYAREARHLARYEKQLVRASAACVVTTLQEATELDVDGNFPVEVICNGVCPPPENVAVPDEIRRLQPYALFVGTMDYLPNVDAVSYFAEDILPLVRKSHPEVRFVIAGRNPSRRVRRLSRHPNVVVTGAISEVYPYVLGAAAVVAPFRICQGVQNKILEALAAGQPVVSTSRPARAIGARHGETLLIADTAQEFASAILLLLNDPTVRVKLRGTREFVKTHFDWQKNLDQLERLLERLANLPRTEVGVAGRAEAR
jgi:polysaccharide biosynthesis protein PslH